MAWEPVQYKQQGETIEWAEKIISGHEVPVSIDTKFGAAAPNPKGLPGSFPNESHSTYAKRRKWSLVSVNF